MQALANIGTSEIVSLPDFGLDNIFAKVDTGADSSAIWASNIAELEGELCFTLFGPTSPHFSGEVIRTRKYSLVSIRNSFGQKEVRYKVNMRLRMADRTINARITLANRSSNRFPLLIGRRTLKGKFLVDVSKKHNLIDRKRILLIVAKKTPTNQLFVDNLQKNGLDISVASYDQLIFQIDHNGSKITIDGQEDIANFQLIIFRTSKVWGHPYVSAAIAKYLDLRGIDFIDHSVNHCHDPAKLYQYILMADTHITVPKTIFMLPQALGRAYDKIIAELGLPFILKDNDGHKGDNNWLIKSRSEFREKMTQANDLGIWLLAQQFIANDGDYRYLVLGGQIELIHKRQSQNQNHLNNVSAGGSANLVNPDTMPDQLAKICTSAAKLFELQIAGVDIIQDKNTKLWYCLEVNQSPQLYTGAFVDQKQEVMAKYLSQRLQ